MSWIVETLLINSELIRSRIIEGSDFSDTIEINFSDDLYNDLLQIELTISKMLQEGELSNLEWLILDTFSRGIPLQESVKIIKLSRSTITKYFLCACDKIAVRLGKEFSDDYIIDRMAKEYKLSVTQLLRLKRYMKSNQRHKLRQKEYHGKDTMDS